MLSRISQVQVVGGFGRVGRDVEILVPEAPIDSQGLEPPRFEAQ